MPRQLGRPGGSVSVARRKRVLATPGKGDWTANKAVSRGLTTGMKIRVAYVDEPPFYWTGSDGDATGVDIELAEAVLGAIGATSVEFIPVEFGELLPGLKAGQWEVNVPIFITPERAREVSFTRPVWSLVDGFVVAKGNPLGLNGYADVAAQPAARLGVIPGQVQLDAAITAQVPDERLVRFRDQAEGVAALLAGTIDAFAGTALGNRAVTASEPALEDVVLVVGVEGALSGAFSVRRGSALLDPLNRELGNYLGSKERRESAARYGMTATEIDPVLAQ